MKERNSLRGGVLGISLEGSSSRGRVSRKTTTGREPGQSVAGRKRVYSSKAQYGPSYGGKSAKSPEERDQELKASWYYYNQEKNQGSNLNLKVFY